jgi:hypothetical protein
MPKRNFHFRKKYLVDFIKQLKIRLNFFGLKKCAFFSKNFLNYREVSQKVIEFALRKKDWKGTTKSSFLSPAQPVLT